MVWRKTPIFPFHTYSPNKRQSPRTCQRFPDCILPSLERLPPLPKMAEASWLTTSEKETRGLFKTPAGVEDPGAIAPNAGMKKGGTARETHHFQKQAPTAGRAGFWTPHRKCEGASGPEGFYVWDGGSHLGWLGRVGPVSSHWMRETWGAVKKYLQLSCPGLTQCTPTLGDPSQMPVTLTLAIDRKRNTKSCFLYGICGLGQKCWFENICWFKTMRCHSFCL